jgi:hypothetical protein
VNQCKISQFLMMNQQEYKKIHNMIYVPIR